MSRNRAVIFILPLFLLVMACNFPALVANQEVMEEVEAPVEVVSPTVAPPTSAPATPTNEAVLPPVVPPEEIDVPMPDEEERWLENNEGLNTYRIEKHEAGCTVDFMFEEGQKLVDTSFTSLSKSRNTAHVHDVLTGMTNSYEDWKTGKFVGFTEEQLVMIVYNPDGFTVQFYPKGDHPADDIPCAYLFFSRVD
jgi:hypothetical protein